MWTSDVERLGLPDAGYTDCRNVRKSVSEGDQESAFPVDDRKFEGSPATSGAQIEPEKGA